jgi:hypothetical protein
MSSEFPSAAMPFGSATAVMAAVVTRKLSVRPIETVSPLAEKLKYQLHIPCGQSEAECFADKVSRYLTHKGTVVASWPHESIPGVVQALKIPNLPSQYNEWPQSCPSETFQEPECCFEVGSTCYDIIWQVEYHRADSNQSWQPQLIRTLAKGFGGAPSSPCAQDLAPAGNAAKDIFIM